MGLDGLRRSAGVEATRSGVVICRRSTGAGEFEEVPYADLQPLLAPTGYSVTAQAISATTAYVAGSALTPTALRIGTAFHWRLIATKTAAGSTAGCAVLVKVGTAGTTADDTLLTFTLGTPTAAVDAAYFDVIAQVRSNTATGVLSGGLSMTHNLAATGFSTLPTEVLQATSSAFDATVAGLIVGLAITTTTASVWSIENVYVTASRL